MIYLREILICPLPPNHSLLVLRSGKTCEILASFSGISSLLSFSKPAIKIFKKSLKLPVRVLEPEAAMLLGLETLLSKAQNLPDYKIGDPLRSL